MNYNDKLKLAKEALDSGSYDKETIEYIFPELKYSEDEMIRKELIEFVKSRGGFKQEYIAWLEKQGEKYIVKPYEWDDEKKCCYPSCVISKQESEDEKIRKVIIEHFAGSHSSMYPYKGFTKKQILAWLEKQGEISPVFSNSSNIGKVEQKPADKVEPKFKVGDWVVCEAAPRYTAFKIGDVVQISNKETLKLFLMFEDCFRLWDITKDAKDGDVLVASDDSIFLFKDAIDCACKHYVALTADGVVKFNEGLEHFWETSTAVHPATQEQRDTLMNAMADAGYNFDFEKKELKKIEQEYTPKHKVGDTIYYNSFGEVKSMVVDNVFTDGTDNPMYEDENGSAVFEKALIEQKPVEWSEEDLSMIGEIRSIIEKYAFSQSAVDVNGELCDKEFIDADNWLKSLRPQKQWKPSEEQMNALNDVISSRDIKYDVLSELWKDLKKLK